MKFNPCTGECTEKGTHCVSCNRSHKEIAETNNIVKELLSFTQKMEYENPDDFLNFVSKIVMFNLRIAQSDSK
jgi:hypothetical protein